MALEGTMQYASAFADNVFLATLSLLRVEVMRLLAFVVHAEKSNVEE